MTLFQFYQKFDTDEKCFDYLAKIRWPDGVNCPHCGHIKHYVISTAKRSRSLPPKINKGKPKTEYKCANSKCWRKFNAITGSIFSQTKLPLWQFFYLIFSSAMNKKNVSSFQQATNLGISQKSCWYIMMRIRMLCWQDESLMLGGCVEVDETYLAAAKWKRRQLKNKDMPNKKAAVLGLLQRGGRVIVRVIPNKDKRTVQDIIFKHVEVDSRLFTDSAACYFGLGSYFLHESVNHRNGEYVRGDVYTNGIESFWSNAKSGIKGTHNGCSKLHLQRYLDELAYRWNNKHLTPSERFNDLIRRALITKPVRYKSAIGAFAERNKKKIAQAT
jgi:DNA-directed RNA polymerase subunit RPC12/RpoP/transposase-like protein